MTEFLLNLEESPEDLRDWHVSSFLTSDNPSESYLCPNLLPARNQGKQGTCAAQTAACMKEWQENRDYGYSGYMSPQFVYNNRSNKTTSGMHSRDVMRILNSVGIVYEDDYVYGSTTDFSPALLDMAKNHVISGYAKVDSIEELKSSLKQNGPCLIAFPVYNHGERMWIPDGVRQGGHAMTVVGYDKDGFIIRNSWGPGWGQGGNCVYPYTEWGHHWEIWTTVDAKSEPVPQDVPQEDTKNISCPCKII